MPDSQLQELIQATSLRLGISQFVIEKDWHVTQAIAVVSQVSHKYFDLVFQGGTCLAKAHSIVQRMSEDCDFRMRLKNSELLLSKEAKRQALRTFRHELVIALRDHGFSITDADLRTRNEGQFMSVRAKYTSSFAVIEGLKPYIALEFFLGNIKTPVEIKPVTTLIQQTLGDRVSHLVIPVSSVSVIETAAEKWVALTRRIATATHREHYRDASLVRHLYDLYKIEQQGLFTSAFEDLAATIVKEDSQQYKNHNNDYYLNPCSEILRGLEILKKEAIWQQHWEQFMNAMVYDTNKPSYQAALDNLEQKTQTAITRLNLSLHQ